MRVNCVISKYTGPNSSRYRMMRSAFLLLMPRYSVQNESQCSDRVLYSFSLRMRRRHAASAAEQRPATAPNARRSPMISRRSNSPLSGEGFSIDSSMAFSLGARDYTAHAQQFSVADKQVAGARETGLPSA